MKKVCSLICVFTLIAAALCMNVSAINSEDNTVRNYDETIVAEFDDGSYITASIIMVPSTRLVGTQSGQKNYTYYDNHDEAQWLFTVYGTFYINGGSVNCQSVSTNYQIYQGGWKLDSTSSYPNGNQAVGRIIIKKTLMGIPVKTYDQTVTLTCDANANLY